MKKLIFGISMLLGGILGMVGIIIATAIEGNGFGGSRLTACIGYAGMMPYFIVFALLSFIGLVIAYKESYEAK